jgi:hypothetical protein
MIKNVYLRTGITYLQVHTSSIRGRPDLSLPSEKRFTTYKLLFSSWHYPRKLALTSL